MHILATNDDGIFHPSLLAMVQELRKIGKVTIVAPDHNWSAAGHQKTLRLSRGVKESDNLVRKTQQALKCENEV